MRAIRPGRPADAEAFLELRAEIFPYMVNTPEGMRHHWASTPAKARERLFAVEQDGRLVGWARCGLNTMTSEPGAATLAVLVRPAYQRRGIGAALLAEAERHLREIGARRVQGWASDDPDTLRFLHHHGFHKGHSVQFSSLALRGGAALPPVPAAPPGVSVVSIAEIGPEATYEVDKVAMADEPGDIAYDAVEYAEWQDSIWADPDVDRELSMAVLVDGEPAALTFVQADLASRRCWSAGTGTLPAYRGRGLAKLAKSVALRRAAEAGIETAYTSNDHTNAPMLAVNEWLGYRPVGAEWSCLKLLRSGS